MSYLGNFILSSTNHIGLLTKLSTFYEKQLHELKSSILQLHTIERLKGSTTILQDIAELQKELNTFYHKSSNYLTISILYLTPLNYFWNSILSITSQQTT